jgi:5-(carboxyamino)imidazole ribonucleotide synthase
MTTLGITAAFKSLPPGSTLGFLGGGQLGRMAAHAAQRLGYHVASLDPDTTGPGMQASAHKVVGAYDDINAWGKLLGVSQAISTEFENVPAPALAWLAERVQTAPRAAAVQIAQDRVLEKQFFSECAGSLGVGQGVQPAVGPVAYAVIDDASDLQTLSPTLFPGILKTTRLGYDGKGQITVRTAAELGRAWDELGRVTCVLEQRVALAEEWSIVIARGHDGHIVTLPAQRNEHRGGILHKTTVLPNFEENQASPSIKSCFVAIKEVANRLNHVGVLCVEFFRTTADQWFINEMAPRPHNSGHHSIESCSVSQFELQVRCMAGLPLVQPELIQPAIMLNVLGDLWFTSGSLAEPNWPALHAMHGVHLHLYGKAQARKGRKMGHITVLGRQAAEVESRAAKVEALLWP